MVMMHIKYTLSHNLTCLKGDGLGLIIKIISCL